MDDPTPISFNTDGTLYKRAVQLPNGDWVPVTDCCCGPSDTCFIIVLACGCDDLRQALYTPVGSAIDIAWPYADRLAGKAISVNGICYRYIGSATTVPPFADLLSGLPGTVYDSCDDSPCSDQAACPPCPGGFVALLARGIGFPIQFFWECVQDFRVECIASMEVTYSATASETFTESNNGQTLNEHSVNIAVDFTATFIGPTNAPTYSVTESSSGFARTYNTSGGLTSEDVWDYQDTHTSGLSTGNMYFDSVSQSLLPGVRVYGASGSDITNGVGFSLPSSTNALLQSPFVCNGSFDDTTTADDGATTTQTSTSSVSHSPTASSVSATSRRIDTDGDYFTDLEWANTSQITRRITLVDGTVIVFVECDGPSVPVFGLAARCGNELMTIPVDVETRTDGFYNCYYQGKLYRLTTESTEDQPFDVEWTADECPTQPDEWPLAVECGGGGAITFDPAGRPGDGVTIQVGSTVYLPVAAMSNEPPTAGVWSPDGCPGPTGPCAGLVQNDPLCAFAIYRDCPQCVGFDIGDPQPEPTNEQQGGTIPGLGDMIAEAIRTVTFNTLLPCGACERRKEVFNRFGERAGAAIIKRLGW